MSTPITKNQSTVRLSSLNPSTPSTTGPNQQSQLLSSSISRQHYNNENTCIYQELLKFESELQNLVASIQQYEPNPEIAVKLVSSMDTINNELNQLEILHDLKMNQILKQNNENLQLDNNSRTILVTLNDCRKELNQLPKLSIEEEVEMRKKMSDDQNPFSNTTITTKEPNLEATKQLLTYAMKLAKFSKIPRTFDGFLMPNNFIWPGDDNMRKGMLATASMMPDKIIKNENGEDTVIPEATDDAIMKDNSLKENGEDDEEEEDEFIPERNESSVISTTAKAEKKDAASVMADLDLFDESDDNDE